MKNIITNEFLILDFDPDLYRDQFEII